MYVYSTFISFRVYLVVRGFVRLVGLEFDTLAGSVLISREDSETNRTYKDIEYVRT